jgi:hypothetical protein
MISQIYAKLILHLPRFWRNLSSMTNLLGTTRYLRPASVPVIRAVVIIIGILLVGVGVVQVPYTPA